MEFLALDLPVGVSAATFVSGLVTLLLLIAGGIALGIRADSRRLLAQRAEPVRKAA